MWLSKIWHLILIERLWSSSASLGETVFLQRNNLTKATKLQYIYLELSPWLVYSCFTTCLTTLRKLESSWHSKIIQKRHLYKMLFIAIVITNHLNSSTTPLSFISFLFRVFAVFGSRTLRQIFVMSVELILQISLLLREWVLLVAQSHSGC